MQWIKHKRLFFCACFLLAHTCLRLGSGASSTSISLFSSTIAPHWLQSYRSLHSQWGYFFQEGSNCEVVIRSSMHPLHSTKLSRSWQNFSVNTYLTPSTFRRGSFPPLIELDGGVIHYHVLAYPKPVIRNPLSRDAQFVIVSLAEPSWGCTSAPHLSWLSNCKMWLYKLGMFLHNVRTWRWGSVSSRKASSGFLLAHSMYLLKISQTCCFYCVRMTL